MTSLEESESESSAPASSLPQALPSVATLRFVAERSGKAAFAQAFVWVVLAAVGGGLGLVVSADAAHGALNVCFSLFQFVMLSHAALALFMGHAQRHANKKDDDQEAPAADRWEGWFNAALVASIVAPLAGLYVPSTGSLADFAQCQAAQWALKLLCFVSFPREVHTMSG